MSATPESIEAAREQELLRGRPYDMIRALRSAMSELWSDKAGLLGAGVILIIVVSAIFAPWLAPHDPNEQSLLDRLTPPFQTWNYPLGTNSLGQDELSQLLFGARTSLIVGFVVVLIAGTFGVVVGLVAGYRGGRWDS
jgi:peptide/nickel transport system permease protein